MRIKPLITKNQKEALYKHIFQVASVSGERETQIIRKLLKNKAHIAEIKTFHAAYRKWKERMRKYKAHDISENSQ